MFRNYIYLDMTFLQLKCLLTKILQTKSMCQSLDDKDYKKILMLDEDTRKLNYKNEDIISLYDNGEKIEILRKEDEK